MPSNSAIAYGCLASTSLFAVYGLTGGFKNTSSPRLNVGYDHYPVVQSFFVYWLVE